MLVFSVDHFGKNVLSKKLMPDKGTIQESTPNDVTHYQPIINRRELMPKRRVCVSDWAGWHMNCFSYYASSIGLLIVDRFF